MLIELCQQNNIWCKEIHTAPMRFLINWLGAIGDLTFIGILGTLFLFASAYPVCFQHWLNLRLSYLFWEFFGSVIFLFFQPFIYLMVWELYSALLLSYYLIISAEMELPKEDSSMIIQIVIDLVILE